MRVVALAGIWFLLLAVPGLAVEPEAVTFTGPPGVTLKALFYRPSVGGPSVGGPSVGGPSVGGPSVGGPSVGGPSVGGRSVNGPRPVVIALHGCGGNMRADGSRLTARVPDWTARFLAAGYAVLWPDSFGSRGLGPQCGVANRDINPTIRARDALAAKDWIGAQSNIDTARIALIGWSHGGSTVLRTVSTMVKPPLREFTTAIAFYPGCRPLAEREARDRQPWATRMPLTILMGGADDWTPPEPCRTLGARKDVRYVEYPDAYHDFDAPNAPIRVRTGLAFTANNSGQAHVGTHPVARAAAIEEVMRVLADAFK